MSELIRVLPLAGDPTNGTIFPREEKAVWKEIQTVIDEMVSAMVGGYRLIIPIRNKFDLEFLRSAEIHKVPVDFMLPHENWGTSHLPQFQLDLISRMKRKSGNRIFIVKNNGTADPVFSTGNKYRIEWSIMNVDMILRFDNTSYVEQYDNFLRSTPAEIHPFPVDRMRFTTEKDAERVLNEGIESEEYTIETL